MSDISVDQRRAPLGAGTIIADSFAILMSKFPAVVIMAFVPAVIGLIISGLLTGWNVVIGTAAPDFGSTGSAVASILSFLVDMVVYGVTAGLLAQLAYDAKLGRPLRFNHYIARALSAAIPIAILGIVATLLTALASVALIIPGLWVMAVFSVMAPAVVIEGIGFGGLGRSASLTKGYRWPIIGTLIVFLILLMVIGIAGGVVAAFVADIGVLVSMVILAIVTAVAGGLFGIAVALVYARLREIKEGVSVDQIASVFD